MTPTRRCLVLLLGLASLGATSAAQVASAGREFQARATVDVAIESGDLDAAERALYAASRRAPREPSARGALGAWLAARGQLRIGTVLLEESRLFGGDAVAIAERLAHIYTWLRDWSSLAALPSSPLSPAERSRATLLAARTTETTGSDSVVVPFAPLEVGAIGRMPIVLGTDTLWGEIDPQVEGLVLPGLARGAGLVEVVGDDRRGVVAVVREFAVGALLVRHTPARIDASLGVGRARIGLDVFAALAPTVDARAGMVTLRRSGRVAEREVATGMPLLLGFPGVRIAARRGAPLASLTAPAGRAALRGGQWTIDVRRGMIWRDTPR